MVNKNSIAIVGAGMAGARAAETLRAEGFDDRIFLIGDEGRLPYERPPLSKECLLGSTPVASTNLRAWEDWMDIAVHLVLDNPLVALDTAGGSVVLADGLRIKAQQVLLATGGVPLRLDVAGAGLAGIHYLRTAADTEALGDRLRRGRLRVAIIGGGFLSVEVASVARSLGNEVSWLCRSRHPLTGMVGGAAALDLVDRYPSDGLSIHRGAVVAGFRGDGAADRPKVTGVVLADGSTLDTDLVFVAIGQRPAVGYLDRLAARNGIEVDHQLQTSLPGVFAAGDIANFVDPFVGGRVRHGSWLNAQNQGVAAARAMLGSVEPYRAVPWHWSDHFGINVQVAGRVDERAHIVVRRGPGGSSSYLHVIDQQLVGAVGIDAARDVRGAMLLMEAQVPVTVDELEDPAFDLRRASAAIREGARA